MVSRQLGSRALCGVGIAAALSVACSTVDARRLAPGPGVLPPVSASEVVLYICQPACPVRDDVAEIVVAQDEMTLAEVLLALRLEAAHRGANGVMDIRVGHDADAEGNHRFRITGSAIRCRESEDGVRSGPDAVPDNAPQSEPPPPPSGPRPRR